MPRKNSLKSYVENGFYHLYNRGVEKRRIFLDDQDYRVFLFAIKKCLLPKEKWDEDASFRPRTHLGELADEIDLLAHCLMPNHFHLLVKQKTKDGITKLMSKISTSYSMYFNKRNNRVGSLFQGVYKAVMVQSDEQLLHLSRYIHLNPVEKGKVAVGQLSKFPYSSYSVYLGQRKVDWVKPGEILSFFSDFRGKNSGSLTYRSFVEGYKKDFEEIASLLIDGDSR